ncbi:MAG: MMPL family transporter [Proteobacteria bacterium]|nr:MMPL family transporter [Pseudomonadota bacterium]
MPDIKKRIELFFENLSRTFYRNRVKTLVIMALFIGFTGSFCRNLTVDTATEAMLHKTDPSLMKYNAFRDQFGRSEMVAVLVEAPDIFDRDFLNRLNTLQQDLEQHIPYLKNITSLINVRSTYGKDDVLHVNNLIENIDQADLADIKKRALNNPFYENYILSGDKKSTALIIETVATVVDKSGVPVKPTDDFEDFGQENPAKTHAQSHYITADEKAEVNAAVNRIVAQYQADNFKLTFSGGAVVVDVFNNATATDTTRLVKIMIGVILIFLYLMFRRVSGMILPIVIVVCATVTTLGFMGITRTPISIMTNILPGFLVSVCIADAVHVLAIFYREFQKGASKENAICHSMGHSGLAIFMTSLTTAAGLLSFSIAEIATISELGYFSAAGVMLGLIYTIILLPALISAIPIVRKPEQKTEKASLRMDKFLLFFGEISIRYPYRIIAICLVLFVVSVYAILQLHFSSYVLTYFPKNHPVKLDLQHMENHLGGSVNFEVIVDTKRENGIQDPDLLKKIDAVIPKINAIKNDAIYVGNVFSINDIIKETNQALHNNDPSTYVIPEDAKTVAQELLLFENSGSDDLEKISDSLFSKTRITIKTKWADSVIYETFLDDLYTMFQEAVGDKGDVTITGIAALLARTIPAALYSMLESYIIALVIITILMIILVGDLKLGLISMFPNLLPIFMVFGLISIMGVKLDINTLFIGSVAIGLVVDDTIHFMYNFRKYYDQTNDPKKAIRETFLGTGRALLITTIVLSMNFFVLMFATLNHSIKFGFFTGMAIFFALFADFFLSPALLFLVTRQNEKDAQENPEPDSDRVCFAEST